MREAGLMAAEPRGTRKLAAELRGTSRGTTRNYPRISASIVIICFACMLASPIWAAITDTYEETFDNREDGATINGVDSWSVDQGAATNAVTEDEATPTGSGKSLKLAGAATSANVSRTAGYGEASPCWVEFKVRPALGAQSQSVPSGKIAALTFDQKGKIYASDGSSWTDTGEAFTAGEWYTVLLKLDFNNHLYNIYIEPTAAPEPEFIPDKENLNFIDSTIDDISKVGFEGVYSATQSSDDTYIDDLIVHFVDRLEIISAGQTLMAGQPSSPITVQMQNSYSAPQTAWEDVQLELRSTSTEGEFSLDRDNWRPISTITIPENAQQAVFYYKDIKEGTPVITAKEYPDRGWEEASQQEKVVAEVSYFDISVTTPQTAGEYFSISITAKDESGKVNEVYSGEIEILPTYVLPATGSLGITPQGSSGFKDGVLNLDIMYPDCGTIEILARDAEEPSKTGHSGNVLFKPAFFSVSADNGQVVTRPFPASIAAYNALGGVAPNYIGPAELAAIAVEPEEVSGGSFAPALLGEDDFVNGIADVNVTYNRWGTIKIEARDAAYPTQTGMSSDVKFLPAAVKIEVTPPSGGRTFYYTGEEIELIISIVDDAGEPIPNYTGSIVITPMMGFDIATEYDYLLSDGGKRSFLAGADTAGDYKIDAAEESGLTAQSEEIEVKQALLEVIDTTAPAGTSAEVTIRLVDEDGNLITADSTLTATVEVTEEIADGTAYSPTVSQPVTFKNGVAKILVTDSQAETVTVSAKSGYKFKTKDGTVVFGRIAKSGIGAVLWREIKE